jgi:uncharacterized DUF497 family protein
VRYTWDPKKAKSNLKRHGVSFEEAAAALEGDPDVQVEPDYDHDEARFRAVAWSTRGRFLFIVIVERDENNTRIISARKATAREQEEHDKSQN